MNQRPGTKRSKQVLKRLIEEAVNDECRLPGRGLWFCVDEIEVFGQPPERIKVWGTLHFMAAGSPFCCGEPGCHLCIMDERQRAINQRVSRDMGLEQGVSIDIGWGDRIAVQYHEGVEFHYGCE